MDAAPAGGALAKSGEKLRQFIETESQIDGGRGLSGGGQPRRTLDRSHSVVARIVFELGEAERLK